MGWPQICIREPPPSIGEPENQVRPARRAIDFEQHEQASRCQQRAHICQCLAQIRRGVDRVGREDHIERAWRESLLLRRLLDVEELTAHKREIEKLLLGFREEAAREIGENVIGSIRGQARQDVRGHPAGAGADFKDAQRPAFRQILHHRCDRFRHEQITSAERHGVLIEMFRTGERSVGENQFERVDVSSENAGQFASARPDQRQLGEHSRKLIESVPPERIHVRDFCCTSDFPSLARAAEQSVRFEE